MMDGSGWLWMGVGDDGWMGVGDDGWMSVSVYGWGDDGCACG